MTPAQDELVIQEGNELTIQCEGAGRLQFSKQTNSAEARILIYVLILYADNWSMPVWTN